MSPDWDVTGGSLWRVRVDLSDTIHACIENPGHNDFYLGLSQVHPSITLDNFSVT